jgi:RNase adaptor protein for sRNA GlmZ degradation
MTEYTPETLREGLPLPIGEQPDEQVWLDAHANIWKAEREQHRKELAYEGRENVYLKAEVIRLEAERDALVRQREGARRAYFAAAEERDSLKIQLKQLESERDALEALFEVVRRVGRKLEEKP